MNITQKTTIGATQHRAIKPRFWPLVRRDQFGGQFISSNGRMSVSVSVQHLLGTSGPSAIIRFIIAIIIDPVYRQSMRFFSHISEKINKRIHPSFANRYPSPAISIPMLMVYIGASLNYSGPSTVFRAWFTNQGMAMFEPHHASTAFGITASQVIAFGKRFAATITDAKPIDFLPVFTTLSNNNKMSVSVPSEINLRGHNTSMLNCTTKMYFWKRVA